MVFSVSNITGLHGVCYSVSNITGLHGVCYSVSNMCIYVKLTLSVL